MSSVALTLPEAARIMRQAVRDKSYQAFPLGGRVGAYLRWKRGRLTPSSYDDRECVLDKLARFFPDLDLEDFEPPVGTERLEEFMDFQWGGAAPRTYNKALSYTTDFFKWGRLKGHMVGDPTLHINRAKARDPEREVFSEDAERSLVASQPSRRDRLCLHLLLVTGLRKGALRSVQFKHFNHARHRLTIFTKGGKVRIVPIPNQDFWNDLERHILDWGAQPSNYLLCRVRRVPHKRNGRVEMDTVEFRDEPMGNHGAHDWWYGCLERAGLVAESVRRGERMHKARHTAGQRVLDETKGNLKAVQKLLGHKLIETTGDIYVDWDIDQLESTLREIGR